MNISRRTALKLGLIGAGSCLSPLEFPLSAVAATQDRCLPHPRDASRPTLVSSEVGNLSHPR